MGGGVVQDALSEVNVVKKLEEGIGNPQPQVKVRCQKCQGLNDETAKFCNQCGAAI
jgi:rRNA maturation endonuclease Nob1